MRKYVKMYIVTAFLVALLLLIPTVVNSFIVKVSLVKPYTVTINEDIYVSGAVEESVKRDVYVDIPVVPSKVNVEIGDYVEINEILAEVDTQATQAAIFQMASATNLIPQEYLSVMGKINISDDLVNDLIPTQIKSPTNGIVTSMALIPGSICAPKMAVCTVSSTQDLRVRMTVSELDSDKIKVGETVVFKAEATGEEKYTGIIERIFPTATKTLVGTSQQTLVGLFVKPDKQNPRLKPGYTVSGVIKKPQATETIVVPYEAVLQDNDNVEYVYVYMDGHAVKRNIVTGLELREGVEVKGGLSEDEIIIKNPQDIKNEKTPIRYVG